MVLMNTMVLGKTIALEIMVMKLMALVNKTELKTSCALENNQAFDLHLSVTTDEGEEIYEDVDEEEDEDDSKSSLIDQVCAYLTTGKYKDSCDKNKKRMIRRKAQRFTIIEGVLHYKMIKKFCKCIPS